MQKQNSYTLTTQYGIYQNTPLISFLWWVGTVEEGYVIKK